MHRHTVSALSLTLVLAIVLTAVGTAASEAGQPAAPEAPLTGAPTVVSYQGQVTVAGTPYTGTGYFKFAIMDSATGDGATNYWANDGAGSSEPAASVSVGVANGLFNVLLGDTGMTPLPASAFAGTERFLRAWFSQTGGPGTFVALEPNRRIAAVPYALQAEETKNADQLDGLHASAFQQHYQGVKVVAKSGGDYTTVSAALAAITDAGDANRYLIKVMPGVYSERVTMKPYVDIEGAGELTTKITYTGSASQDTGTVVGADNAELRFLSVENTGGNAVAIAIYNNPASPRLTHVTASASGGSNTNYGVYNSGASPMMTNVTASASGGNFCVGLQNQYASPVMTNVTASASGGVHDNYGILSNWSSPTMMNVTASASGGSRDNDGVYNYNSTPLIRNSVISAGGASGNRYGIYNTVIGNNYTVQVNNSQVSGVTNSIYNTTNTGSITVLIGASQLSGGAVSGGTVTCAGVYDEAYAFYASTCP